MESGQTLELGIKCLCTGSREAESGQNLERALYAFCTRTMLTQVIVMTGFTTRRSGFKVVHVLLVIHARKNDPRTHISLIKTTYLAKAVRLVEKCRIRSGVNHGEGVWKSERGCFGIVEPGIGY